MPTRIEWLGEEEEEDGRREEMGRRERENR